MGRRSFIYELSAALTVVGVGLGASACRLIDAKNRRSNGGSEPAAATESAPAPDASPVGEPVVVSTEAVTVTVPPEVFGPKVDLVIAAVRDPSVFVDTSVTTLSVPQSVTLRKDGVDLTEPSASKTYEVTLVAPAIRADGTRVDPARVVVQAVFIAADGSATRQVLRGTEVAISFVGDKIIAIARLRHPRVELAVGETNVEPSTTPPLEATLTLNDGAPFTASRQVKLALANAAGVTEARVGNGTCNGAAWKPYSGPIDHDLAVGADGGRAVCVEVRDAAGRLAAGAGVITLDTTPPAAPTALKTSDDSPVGAQTSIADDTEIHFSWAAAVDAGSGLRDYELAVYPLAACAGTPTTYTMLTATSKAHAGADGETYSFRVSARDQLGHAVTSGCSPDITIASPAGGARVTYTTLSGAASAGTTPTTYLSYDADDGLVAGDRLILAYVESKESTGDYVTSLARNGVGLVDTYANYAVGTERTHPHMLWALVSDGSASDVYSVRHHANPSGTSSVARASIVSIGLEGMLEGFDWFITQPADVGTSGGGQVATVTIPGFNNGNRWIALARVIVECNQGSDIIDIALVDPAGADHWTRLHCPADLASGNGLFPIVIFNTYDFTSDASGTFQIRYVHQQGGVTALRKIGLFAMRAAFLGVVEGASAAGATESAGVMTAAASKGIATTAGGKYIFMAASSVNAPSGSDHRVELAFKANASTLLDGRFFVAGTNNYGPFAMMAPHVADSSGTTTAQLEFRRIGATSANTRASHLLLLRAP